MGRQDAHPACAPVESNDANESIDNINNDNSIMDGGADTPTQPRHDMLYVPNFPVQSIRSGLMCDSRVQGGAMLILDNNSHSPIAFSAGLPDGIQLSQLPDPCSVCKAMAAPDAEGWKDAMDREMKILKSHDVYELVPHASSMQTLPFSWVLHRKFRNGIFEKNEG